MASQSDWITEYFSKRWDASSRPGRFAGQTAEDLNRWQTNRRQALAGLLKMEAFEKMIPEHRVLSTEPETDHEREEILLQTEPDYWSPVTVLRPTGGSADNGAAVVALHGHAGGGRASVAGGSRDPEIAGAIDRFNYDYGVQLVRKGFTVFCPDARGFGDRRGGLATGDRLGSNCREIANLAGALGMTLVGMLVWDICRIVDFIRCSRGGEDRLVGCVGFSGGGLQTLYAAALDARIGFAVTSGYFYGFKQALLEQYGNCSCNYVPGLWQQFDAEDIAALVAPRPLFIETGASDDLNGASGIANVVPQIETVRRVYDAAGAGDNLTHRVYDGDHRFYGEHALDWAVSLARAR